MPVLNSSNFQRHLSSSGKSSNHYNWKNAIRGIKPKKLFSNRTPRFASLVIPIKPQPYQVNFQHAKTSGFAWYHQCHWSKRHLNSWWTLVGVPPLWLFWYKGVFRVWIWIKPSTKGCDWQDFSEGSALCHNPVGQSTNLIQHLAWFGSRSCINFPHLWTAPELNRHGLPVSLFP